MKERNYTVDLFKYIASLCIIVIHTTPFADVSAFWNVVSVQIIARLAVPFFAVCSGYYSAGNVWNNPFGSKNVGESYWKQWNKLIIIYAFWTVLYLLYSIPQWLRTGWFSPRAFVDYAVDAIRSSSHYHLWYLLSLIYAWPFFYLCAWKMNRKLLLPTSLVLYLVKVIDYAYLGFMPEWAMKVSSLLHVWDALFDAIFLLLPLLLLGKYLHDTGCMSRRSSLIMLTVSIFLLCAEAWNLYRTGSRKVSFILTTFPTAYAFFSFLLTLREPRMKNLCAKLGAASLFIYCFHPMAVELLEAYSVPCAPRFFLTAVVSSIVGCTVVWLKRNKRKKV